MNANCSHKGKYKANISNKGKEKVTCSPYEGKGKENVSWSLFDFIFVGSRKHILNEKYSSRKKNYKCVRSRKHTLDFISNLIVIWFHYILVQPPVALSPARRFIKKMHRSQPWSICVILGFIISFLMFWVSGGIAFWTILNPTRRSKKMKI